MAVPQLPPTMPVSGGAWSHGELADHGQLRLKSRPCQMWSRTVRAGQKSWVTAVPTVCTGRPVDPDVMSVNWRPWSAGTAAADE